MSTTSVNAMMGDSSLSPSPNFTPTQLSFFHVITGMIDQATNGVNGVEMTPLKQLLELVIHQRGDRSHADTCTVVTHILPELAARLQSMHTQKVKVWLLEFLEQLPNICFISKASVQAGSLIFG